MKILFLLLFFFIAFVSPLHVLAQEPSERFAPIETTYERGKVTSASEPSEEDGDISQKVELRLKDTGKPISLDNSYSKDALFRKLNVGDELVIAQTKLANGSVTNTIVDRYRLTPLLWLAALFFLIVIIAAGRRGVGAILGLGISLAVILLYIVPQILKGADPLLIAISGSLVIMLVTIYLAHGFSQKTTVAVASTFFSLLITGFLATFMVNLLDLQGLGSEDAYLLQFQGLTINLKGLLLGGIIIGALGVLDDVTTTQSATIFTLSEANKSWKVKHLITKGLLIGREHITSLVNTLVLAYAGASLPIFLFFVLNPLDRPVWLILNSEMIVEEIVRTLAGSIGLILAVPITTCLAAFFSRYKVKIV